MIREAFASGLVSRRVMTSATNSSSGMAWSLPAWPGSRSVRTDGGSSSAGFADLVRSRRDPVR
jgi:hypothetical protein